MSTPSQNAARDRLDHPAASASCSPDAHIAALVSSSTALPVVSLQAICFQPDAPSLRSLPVKRAELVAIPGLTTVTQPPSTSIELPPFMLPASRSIDPASSVASLPSFHPSLNAFAFSTPTCSGLAAIRVPRHTSCLSLLHIDYPVTKAPPEESR